MGWSRRYLTFDDTLPTEAWKLFRTVEWYINGGMLDLDGVRSGWNRKLAQALDRGYDGISTFPSQVSRRRPARKQCPCSSPV